ncbi:unnamed protein product [Mytilus coruscus]|uniref:Uncharacterized protein n=1 Tax=Mytilus coruscus TaxID=42192 RepID=A0A6J8E1D0_MYTCO|nr:unnamed protein product [Mytilus coruscus]
MEPDNTMAIKVLSRMEPDNTMAIKVLSRMEPDNTMAIKLHSSIEPDNTMALKLLSRMEPDNTMATKLLNRMEPDNTMAIKLLSRIKPDNTMAIKLFSRMEPDNTMAIKLHTSKRQAKFGHLNTIPLKRNSRSSKMRTKNALMAVVVLLVLIGTFDLVDSLFGPPRCYKKFCWNNWDCGIMHPACYCRKFYKGSRIGRCSWW